jgi:hypothetical protein
MASYRLPEPSPPPAALAKGVRTGFPSLPMGSFHESLSYAKHWSTTDCNVADIREWWPRRKSWTTL